ADGRAIPGGSDAARGRAAPGGHCPGETRDLGRWSDPRALGVAVTRVARSVALLALPSGGPHQGADRARVLARRIARPDQELPARHSGPVAAYAGAAGLGRVRGGALPHQPAVS